MKYCKLEKSFHKHFPKYIMFTIGYTKHLQHCWIEFRDGKSSRTDMHFITDPDDRFEVIGINKMLSTGFRSDIDFFNYFETLLKLENL